MISISMITADTNGSVIIPIGRSRLGVSTARLARQATLDGGCVIVHSGVVDCDRTFNIQTKINSDQRGLIEYIHENSAIVLISCHKGIFIGAISTVDASNTDFTMTIFIKDKEL